MAQALQLLLWAGIIGQLLFGIRLLEKASGKWAEAFQADHELMVCGRYQAMAANLRSAVTTWRKSGCAGEEDMPIEEEVEALLSDWRLHYGDWDPEGCSGKGPVQVKLHRERNPDLDEDYPNWTVRYE